MLTYLDTYLLILICIPIISKVSPKTKTTPVKHEQWSTVRHRRITNAGRDRTRQRITMHWFVYSFNLLNTFQSNWHVEISEVGKDLSAHLWWRIFYLKDWNVDRMLGTLHQRDMFAHPCSEQLNTDQQIFLSLGTSSWLIDECKKKLMWLADWRNRNICICQQSNLPTFVLKYTYHTNISSFSKDAFSDFV